MLEVLTVVPAVVNSATVKKLSQSGDIFSWLQPTTVLVLTVITLIALVVLWWTIVKLPTKYHQRGEQGNNTRKYRHLILPQAVGVMLSCAMVLITIGGWMNRANDWYPSWESMWFSVNASPIRTQSTSVTKAVKAKPWVNRPPTELQLNIKDNPQIAVKHWNYKGQGTYAVAKVPANISGYQGNRVLLWLPPGYLSHPQRHYPVIMAFHGYPNTPDVYRKIFRIGAKMDALVSHKIIRQSIIVMPTVFPNNFDTECVDASDKSILVETFLTQDLVPWVKSNLRVVNDPHGWATAGYSAGGWCSSALTVRNPHLFPYSVNLSGYFKPQFSQKKLLASDDHRYDLARVVEQSKVPVRIFFWAAEDDKPSIRSLKHFMPHIHEPNVFVRSLIEYGGHSWPVWKRGFTEGFRWLGKQSDQFAWVNSGIDKHTKSSSQSPQPKKINKA